MTRKTDEERLQDLELKIQQLKARKQQTEARVKEKERKERTRRLIQIGAIFEKYFEIENTNEAEQVALSYHQAVQEHKEQIKNIDIEKSKETGTLIYKQMTETIITPQLSDTSYETSNK